MAAAAIPLISSGIGAVGSYLQNRSKKKAADQQNALTKPPLAGLTAAGDASAGMGRDSYRAGGQALAPVTSYYQRMLTGNRSDLTQALAPEISATTDLYRGAEKNLERTGAQGAQRDVAREELNRDRVGKTASLLRDARSGAADKLTQIGETQQSQGIGATQGAGGIYAQLLSGLNANRETDLKATMYGDQQSAALWKQIGDLLVGSYGAWKGRGAGGTK